MKTRLSGILYLVSAVLMAAVMFTGCPTPGGDDGPAAVSGVAINEKPASGDLSVRRTETLQLTVTVMPDNAGNKAVSWSSSDDTKATVDDNGLVTGVANTTAGQPVTITVTTADGGKTDSVTVRVTAPPTLVTAITVTSDTGITGLKPTETVQLTATVAPTTATYQNVTWSSPNDAVATVSATGLVTGVGDGEVDITATAVDTSGVTGTIKIHVAAAGIQPTSISIVPPKSPYVHMGDTFTLDTVIGPSNATERTIAWSSSAAGVAAVDPATGVITPVTLGTATITATTGNSLTDTCAITVLAKRDTVAVESGTLVHYYPSLLNVNHFGGATGTNNSDGSFTFATGTSWNGGGAQYDFPEPAAGATWSLDSYVVVEMQLLVIEGSVTVGVKKSGGNIDLNPYPSGSSGITFNTTTNDGKFTYTAVKDEAGSGIGFQVNTGGPATVKIEKVVFSTVATYTISFTGLTGAEPSSWDTITIPTGRTVNFNGSYLMPGKPTKDGYHFKGWLVSTTPDDYFNASAPVTQNYALTADWGDGPPPAVDMTLDLNKDNWPTIPPNAGSGADVDWPAGWPKDYAIPTYENNKLTLEFSGQTRQKGVIPLSQEQIDELMYTEESGVTFRINGQAYKEDGTTRWNTGDTTIAANKARFRVHLANPAGGGVSPGTSNLTGGVGDDQSVNIDNLVAYVTFASRDQANLSYLVIQAMYGDTTGTGAGGPPVALDGKVLFIIESVKVEVGDTTE
jgi:uncharacterized repeat protein (TIGR02543 family)